MDSDSNEEDDFSLEKLFEDGDVESSPTALSPNTEAPINTDHDATLMASHIAEAMKDSFDNEDTMLASQQREQVISEALDDSSDTVEKPGPATAQNSEIDLEELILATQGDDKLAETLQEALTLLERDYEDEFTASQILEQAAIDKVLQNPETELDLDLEIDIDIDIDIENDDTQTQHKKG